jgi:predicted nucleotidyltransferase
VGTAEPRADLEVDGTREEVMRMATPQLDDAWLAALAADLSNPVTNAANPIVGVALLGSHARGEATPYSDVDVVRFAEREPEGDDFSGDRYTLRLNDERIVSVSTTSLAAKRDELARPEGAVWAVEGLRQARILLDRDGALAALLAEARAFQWAPLQAAADAYASELLMGLAEEAGKIMGGLARGDDAVCAYGALGLLPGLVRAVIVQRGVLLRSENAFFTQPQEAVGRDSAWARALRLAAGLKALAEDADGTGSAAEAAAKTGQPTPAQAHARASLRLYRETAALLDSIIRPADRPVIAQTLRLLDAFA